MTILIHLIIISVFFLSHGYLPNIISGKNIVIIVDNNKMNHAYSNLNSCYHNLMTCDTELLMLNYLMLMTANDTLSD